jgi:hypothetical protein
LAELKHRLDCWSELPAARESVEYVSTLPPELQPSVYYSLAAWYAYDGEVDQAVATLERLTALPDLPADKTYNAACGYCRCITALTKAAAATSVAADGERIDWLATKAVALLKRVMETGFFDDPQFMNLIANDPDLAPLREREDYRAFIETLKAHLIALDLDN